MTALIILDETDIQGAPLGPVLVNVDAIIRVTALGPNHCAVLTQSFTTGHDTEVSMSDGMISSRFFVAGTLQQLQIRLNCAAG